MDSIHINTIKKILVCLMFFALFVLLPIDGIEARSGCCSHHGGVCGCKCCDGTSLSAKCAPYYPSCNNKPTIPVSTPKPSPEFGIVAAVMGVLSAIYLSGKIR
ncbi:MAG: hypothetical protein O8C63_08710 [Candidatus Methanoperedens sp.]|nr:hypothetical protein [Candidatus Methanoperedens sp.]